MLYEEFLQISNIRITLNFKKGKNMYRKFRKGSPDNSNMKYMFNIF